MTSVVASADRYSVWVVGKDVVIMNKKYNETMIIRCGHLIYAISLKDKSNEEKCSCYIYIENGKVCFADSVFRTIEFDFNNENHQIAKEIFVTQLQTDIKRRILELKQLQSIFEELNLKECFGSVLEDNTKLLLEVKQEVKKIGNTVKADVKEAIKNTVKPIALKKDGNTNEGRNEDRNEDRKDL